MQKGNSCEPALATESPYLDRAHSPTNSRRIFLQPCSTFLMLSDCQWLYQSESTTEGRRWKPRMVNCSVLRLLAVCLVFSGFTGNPLHFARQLCLPVTLSTSIETLNSGHLEKTCYNALHLCWLVEAGHRTGGIRCSRTGAEADHIISVGLPNLERSEPNLGF